MARIQNIELFYSATAGNKPTINTNPATDISRGEIALNLADRLMFVRVGSGDDDSQDQLLEVSLTAEALSKLTDVALSGLAENQALIYNADGKWHNVTLTSALISDFVEKVKSIALPLEGGTLTGLAKYNASVSEESFDDQSLVTKHYVDAVAAGYAPHQACETGSSANVEGVYADGGTPQYPGVGATFTLTANTGNATVISGVTLTQGMRVLLVGQTDQKQNGAYEVTTVPGEATGQVVLTRADDFDGDPEISYNGATFLITHGDLQGTSWRLMNTGNITFGTDEINFVQISAPNEYSAGAGISIEANEVSVKQGATVKVIGGNLEVASGTSNQGKVLVAQGDGAAASWQTLDLSSAVQGTLPVSKGGTGATTLPANQLIVGNGTEAVGSVTNADGVLVGSASGAPAFGKVNLASHVEGVLPVANGGFGTATHTEGAIVVGGAGNALAEVAPAAGVLKSTGTGAPAYGQVNLAAEVSGTLPIANGGTGATEKAQAFANLAPVAANKGDIMYYDGSQWVAFAKGAENALLGYGADGLKVVTKISADTF